MENRESNYWLCQVDRLTVKNCWTALDSQVDSARFSAGFWPPRFTNLGSILVVKIPRNLGRILAAESPRRISAAFWPPRFLEISAGFWPPRSLNLGRQNPAENLDEISEKILYGWDFITNDQIMENELGALLFIFSLFYYFFYSKQQSYFISPGSQILWFRAAWRVCKSIWWKLPNHFHALILLP